jgi:hypothetical protein
MNTDTVNWLVQEVHDLLDVSSVGLYEFMWMLNTPDQSLSIDERKALARQALKRLLAEPGMELTWLRWPEWTSLGKVTFDELPEDPWGDPDENGMYLALNRAE